LNRDGIAPPRGRQWREVTVNVVSRNHAYYGRAVFGKRTKAERQRRSTELEDHWLTAEVPAIVTRDEWDAAQSAVRLRLRSHGRVAGSDDDPYELRGRIRCGHCGKPLACNVNNRRRYYTCQRHKPAIAAEQRVPVCEFAAVPSEDLELLVWDAFCRAAMQPQTLATFQQQGDTRSDALTQRIDGLDRDIWSLRRKIHNYAGQLADERPGSALSLSLREQANACEASIARLTRERDQLERERSQETTTEAIDSLVAFAESLGDELQELNPAARRGVYRALDMQAAIRLDERGIKIGRLRSYSVDLPAWIPR
jgi:hypothetical protein